MTSPTQRGTQLAEALAALRQRVSAAAEAAGRDPAQIELLPVTKFFPASDVALLAARGCRSFGEARDQEARAKIAELAGRLPAEVSWQMIGRLQRNKARSVAGWADAVHSVDGLRLADATIALPLFRTVRTAVQPSSSSAARNPAMGTLLPLPTFTPRRRTTKRAKAEDRVGADRDRRAGVPRPPRA